MNKNITNGAQLERNFIKRYIRFYMGWILWCVAVVVIWILGIHAYFTVRITAQASITIAYVLAFLPFFNFKLWRVFTVRSYEGTITKIENKMVTRVDGLMPYRENLRKKCLLRIDIRTDRGDVYTRDIDYKTNAFGVPYQVGDRVRYYRGTSHLQLVTNDPHRKKICVFCGADIEFDRNTCQCCGNHVIL
ncbi:MAG: hypothetical protein HFE78_04735 [Clostridiales bacterium]|nr:hypothetical protein [Clostridiales bacterium]